MSNADAIASTFRSELNSKKKAAKRGTSPQGPSWQTELYYGFVLRTAVGVVSAVIPVIVSLPVGYFNDWQVTTPFLIFFGIVVGFSVLYGEHLRTLAYETRVRALMLRPAPEEIVQQVGVKEIDENLALVRTAMSYASRVEKRTFDIVISLFLVVLFAPLFLITAVAVKLDSKGPALFRSKRVGRQGRVFHQLKFRTMAVEQLNVHDIDGSNKLRNDPRVTRMGRILRITGIDELPSIIDVLRGEMSLVGPPAMRFDDKEKRPLFRSDVRPGLLNFDVSFVREMQDLTIATQKYAVHWSLYKDVKIIIFKLVVIFRRDLF